MERKNFIFKVSSSNPDRSPKFPKCSHTVKNKINTPLSEVPFDYDIENLINTSGRGEMKQHASTKDSDQKPKAVKGKANDKLMGLKENEKPKAEKGNEKTKSKHNKFIYYTNDDDKLAQNVKSMKEKLQETAPSQINSNQMQKNHKTETQKIHPKDKLVYNAHTQRTENSENEIDSRKDNEVNIPAQPENLQTSADNTPSDPLNTDYFPSPEETVALPFDINAEPVDFGFDIYLSTIRPYFNKLHKPTIAVFSPTDTEDILMQNVQDNVVQPTPTDRTFNRLSIPNIYKIFRIDKPKRFFEKQDVITGDSLDVDSISAIIDQSDNSTLS